MGSITRMRLLIATATTTTATLIGPVWHNSRDSLRWLKSRKSLIPTHTSLINRPRSGWPLSNIRINVISAKLECSASPTVKESFDATPECDRHTDGWTDIPIVAIPVYKHLHNLLCNYWQERPADARVTCDSAVRYSKTAVSRHLGYYRTGNSTIRSAENPCLEPDMEWIGCTVCEIFAFKLYCDLETGVRVTQGHWKLHHYIGRLRNPTLEANITWMGKPVEKLWPFLYIQDGRQPPSWFYRTANNAIRCANPENPSLEPNMEWIGCTICEMFAFKLYCDLENGVLDHSRSSKSALFDREHTTLYSSSIVTMPLSITVSEI